MMCEWDTARFLIFSNNGIPLIYYSHFTAIAIFGALLVMTFLRMKAWPKGGLRMMSVAYIIWLACDLILWGNEQIEHVLFFWTIVNLIEPVIFASAYAHFVSFVENRTLTIMEKILIFILLLPTLFMAPLGLSVVGFDYTTCDRNVLEGVAAYYNYLLEAVFIGLVVIVTIKQFVVNKLSTPQIKRLILSAISLILMMSSFLIANFLGTYFDEYFISQLGHLAVPIFAALLAYIIIKYETVEPRIMFIDLMSSALIVLIFSLFFVPNDIAQKYIVTLTLIMSLPLAISLTKGIRKEVKQREDLELANIGQENLIHIMNHQVKGYLSKGRNIFAELRDEKDYGLPDSAKPMVEEGLNSLTEGVGFVQNVLRGSSAESGKLQFTMKPMNLKTVVELAMSESQDALKSKGLTMSLVQNGDDFNILGDDIQLRESVKNMISNSINYTEHGGLVIHLEKKTKKVLLSIKDTGMGITSEDMPKLFTKGGRGKDSLRYNVNSTGYGLAFVKGVVEAHKGRVWAESAGTDKGSTFYIELPLA